MPSKFSATFSLIQDEDGWPPFSAETLQCSKAEDGLLIETPPFFLPIAVGDTIVVDSTDGAGNIKHWTCKHHQGHSLLEFGATDQDIHREFEKTLLRDGFLISSLPAHGLIAIDATDEVAIRRAEELFKKLPDGPQQLVFLVMRDGKASHKLRSLP